MSHRKTRPDDNERASEASNPELAYGLLFLAWANQLNPAELAWAIEKAMALLTLELDQRGMRRGENMAARYIELHRARSRRNPRT